MRSSAKAGFTLIELFVVIAIISVLAVALLPQHSSKVSSPATSPPIRPI